MRFALVDNERADAAQDLKGVCPGCSQPVIAKCGTRKIWHWAHRAVKMCDQWWEPETDWHKSPGIRTASWDGCAAHVEALIVTIHFQVLLSLQKM